MSMGSVWAVQDQLCRAVSLSVPWGIRCWQLCPQSSEPITQDMFVSSCPEMLSRRILLLCIDSIQNGLHVAAELLP